jgi:2-polyprenyl-3-methyl-5-hydroxy-6-metoxy-1,4-benzoquinol methylase
MEANVYQQFLELERDHWWFRGRRKVYLDILAEQLGDANSGVALDLGCGLGGFLPPLKALGFEVFAADMDFDSLGYCLERGFTASVQIDSYRLPYADNSFDVITMFDVVEHIEDDHTAMKEVARILKPGGRVIISVPAYQFLYANNDRAAQHYRRYSRAAVAELFESSGLLVRRNSHANVLLFPLILPLVLLSKMIESVFMKKVESDHTNLSWPMPAFLHTILYRIFAAELLVSRQCDIPVGHSIAAIAQAPAESP